MSDDNEVKTCKVVLLGESGVGKTCIISRFTNNTFEDNIMSTTGASYCGKAMTFDEYGGKTIKFEIWDTAGQEKYRALTKIFYKDALAAILVYDITRRNSFQEIKNYWYNQIKESAKNDIGKIIFFIFKNMNTFY
jgi:small GTP-binding protein